MQGDIQVGLQLAGKLRGFDPRLKVIYTSGYTMDLTDDELALRDGINFLPKPYPAALLAATVRQCLDVCETPALQ